jgi:hypothetical protein
LQHDIIKKLDYASSYSKDRILTQKITLHQSWLKQSLNKAHTHTAYTGYKETRSLSTINEWNSLKLMNIFQVSRAGNLDTVLRLSELVWLSIKMTITNIKTFSWILLPLTHRAICNTRAEYRYFLPQFLLYKLQINSNIPLHVSFLQISMYAPQNLLHKQNWL